MFHLERMSFKEALENQCILTFDKECVEILEEATKGNISDLFVQDFVGPVVSDYLVHLAVYSNPENIEFFKSIVSYVNDCYRKSKMNVEAKSRQSNFHIVK